MSIFGGYEDQPFLAEVCDYVPGWFDRPDLDFYLDYAQSSGGTILELGCGAGRVLIPTAAVGSRIIGVDISPYMLARCRKKLGRQPRKVQKRVRLVQGDMTHFDLKEAVNLVTTPFRTFQHLISVDDQLSSLRCANRHLAMGGKLILDLFQVNFRVWCDSMAAEECEDFSDVELPGGRKLRRTHRSVALHRAEQYVDCEMIFYITHQNGRTDRLVQAFPYRHFFRYEVEHLLARCGFAVKELFGDFDRSSLSDGSPEMIFVAEKCENLTEPPGVVESG